MSDLLRSLPKAELHVHLEGSLTPETLRELHPSLTREEIDAHYQYEDFFGFLMAYKWASGFLRRPEDYALAFRKLVAHQAEQGCVYAEINLSIGVLLKRSLPFDEFLGAVAEEAGAAPIPVQFVFDAVRQFGVEAAERVAQLAVDSKSRGVVAFGIGGDEASLPLKEFAPVIAMAKRGGLRFVPHAGETTGAAAVWEAVELGADRVGHGIGAAADPALLARLAADRLPLEVSISSNIATGAVASLQAHPLRRIHDAGVPIVLNTDDPPMFGCTLLSEYQLAMDRFGFTIDEVGRLARNSLDFAFR
jgi:adenosine deaminase/aminodeoxyfutalosine deaminase